MDHHPICRDWRHAWNRHPVYKFLDLLKRAMKKWHAIGLGPPDGGSTWIHPEIQLQIQVLRVVNSIINCPQYYHKCQVDNSWDFGFYRENTWENSAAEKDGFQKESGFQQTSGETHQQEESATWSTTDANFSKEWILYDTVFANTGTYSATRMA